MRKRQHYWLAVAILGIFIFSGCGETVRGVGRDTARVGKGVKTIFFTGS